MLSVQGQALLQQLLTFDPTQRITAEDAVRHPYFDEFPLAIDPSMFPTWPSKHDIRNLPSNKGDDKKMVCRTDCINCNPFEFIIEVILLVAP